MNFKKYTSLIFILLIFLYVYFNGSSIPHFCIFEKLFDLKCPFCGITNSFEEILRFNFVNALKINFMSYALLLFLISKFLFNHFKLFQYTLKSDNVFFGLCLIQFFVLNV